MNAFIPTYNHIPRLEPLTESPLLSCLVCLILLSLFNYGFSLILFSARPNVGNASKRPPQFPSPIPFLGIIPFGLFWNPHRWVISSRLFWSTHPMRVTILGQTIYLVQGTSNIAAAQRQRQLSTFPFHQYILSQAFNLAHKTLKTYQADNSGPLPTPYIGSNVQPENRVEYHTTNSVHRFLLGPGSRPLTRRLQKYIGPSIFSLPITTEWVVKDDLLDIFRSDITSAVLDAMCGPYLLEKHPHFLHDLWMIEDNIWKLLSRFPRFLAPRVYSARDRALAAIKDWHAWARENFDSTEVDEQGNDPFWGSQFFRDRQPMFQKMDGFNADAIAAQDLAFFWGAVDNVVVAPYWMTLEIFKDPALLARIRNEVHACLVPPAGPHHQEGEPAVAPAFDMDKLLCQPFLKAVYCETLRLRVSGFFARRTAPHDIEICGWRIPKNSYLASSPTPSQMDPAIWCTGDNEAHPVEEFYIGRWLKPKLNKHSSSEPTVAMSATATATATAASTSTNQVEFEFSAEAARGAWMPFGGGHHLCPGRRVAKFMLFLSTALLVTMYDCEVLGDARDLPAMSMRTFGFGVLGPDRKVPVRMRRRRVRVRVDG
ncbi:cytochrome P450 [Aspergillus crustosus]